jgi:sterol desaturase/sphingolipid hydroxylase (fatty acid hydroxylase superfamily)
MVIVSVTALDLLIYTQRVMVHAVPVFWRLQRVHRADLDYDVTAARTRPTSCPLYCGSRFRA